MNRFILSLALSLLASLGLRAGAVDNRLDFDSAVAPLLKTHCLDCHSGDEPAGNVPLTIAKADFTDEAQREIWQKVLEQLTLGQMPPIDQEQPNPQQTKKVASWITQRLKQLAQTPRIEHKLRAPEFGNYVNHERLFDGSHTGPAASPSRLWRISPYIYDKFVDQVADGLRRETAIHQPFPLDNAKGAIADFSALHFADSATLQLLMMNCQTLAEYQTSGVLHRDHEGNTHRLRRTPPEFEQIIERDEIPTIEQIKTAIGYQYELVLERKPTANENQQLVKFCQRAIELGGNARGLQTTLKAIMMKPEAIYRMEIGLGPTDDHGRRRLSDEELAFAIARALTDKGPNKINVYFPDKRNGLPQQKSSEVNEDHRDPSLRSLLDLARDGVLAKPSNIRRVVRQILDNNNMSTADYRMFTEDHKIGNTRVLRFFREFFGYHHAPKVFKDEKRIGHGERYLTERMVDDADQLVMHIFDEDQDVLRRLLITNEYFVAYLGSAEHIENDMHYIKTNVNDAGFEFNTKYVQQSEAAGRHPIPMEGPDSRMYVGFYNLDHLTWDYPTEQPFPLPTDQRTGILTHPAWLIAWSGNFDNDPIRRGKWIREHLLAGTIPDVPLDVNAVVPENPHKTLRQRLTVTRDEYCWKCHQKMDPLGLPFEQFDDFGRYRERELIGELLSIFPERHEESETRRIDPTGEIVDSGDDNLDGAVSDAFELMQMLAGSDRVRQSFVRHAFRYWMGRNETLDDSPTLIAADQAYVENGGSMKAMIAELLSSDSFLYRK